MGNVEPRSRSDQDSLEFVDSLYQDCMAWSTAVTHDEISKTMFVYKYAAARILTCTLQHTRHVKQALHTRQQSDIYRFFTRKHTFKTLKLLAYFALHSSTIFHCYRLLPHLFSLLAP